MLITTNIEKITPQFAQAILEANHDNRSIKEVIVTQYASDMAAGRWELTGQPIIIADNGMLNDGQHRLHAVIKSGASIDMIVMRGVARDTRAAIDIGQNRTVGDVVSMFHVNNGNAVCALARNVISWETTGKLGISKRISKTVIIERATTDKRLQSSHLAAKRIDALAPQNVVSLSRYIIPDTEMSFTFFDRFADGQDLLTGHPILTLRNYFLRNGRKIPTAVGTEAILRAWMAFVQNREISKIQIMNEFPPIATFKP